MTNPYAPPAGRPKGRVALWLGAILLVLGLAGGATGVWWGVQAASDTVEGYARVPLDGGGAVELEAGRHVLYHEAPGAEDGYLRTPVGVRIVDPSGRMVTISRVSGSETYSIAGYEGRRIGRFTAPVDGTYQVRSPVSDGGGVEELAMGRQEATDGFLAVGLGVVLGGGLALLGVILLIVGGIRRNRSNQPPPLYGGGWPAGGPGGWAPPAPGWAPPGPPGPAGWAPPPVVPPPPGSPGAGGWAPPPPPGPHRGSDLGGGR